MYMKAMCRVKEEKTAIVPHAKKYSLNGSATAYRPISSKTADVRNAMRLLKASGHNSALTAINFLSCILKEKPVADRGTLTLIIIMEEVRIEHPRSFSLRSEVFAS
jgi:hypothetical protein